MQDGQAALICFEKDAPYKKCEIFDGSASVAQASSTYAHHGGKLGMYKGNPTTVGSWVGYNGGNNRVETFKAGSWSSLANHPKGY